jgi:cell volume regulation protein A
MAYVLTLTFITLSMQGGSPDWGGAVLMLVTQLVIGAVAGWLLGKGMVWCVNKINMDNAALYPLR